MFDDELTPLATRCAGLDVAKDEVVACVRLLDLPGGRARCELRTFGATTAELVVLHDWLAAHQVTTVGAESTGVYWKPVYYALEDDFDVQLFNAAQVKGAPGRRKTDAQDAVWIAKVTQYGLAQPSVVPPPPIRRLRQLTRYRRAQTEERTREAQRLDKVLQDAGVKLSSVASQTLGVSGRAMLEGLIGGTRDPEVLAGLARGRLRAKTPALVEALRSRFTDDHALVIGMILAKIDFLDQLIADLTSRIEEAVAPFGHQVDLLVTIPGVDRRLACDLLAELGVDMSLWPTAGHLASWAKAAPGQRESAHKNKSGRTGHGPKWLDLALWEAARSAARTRDCYLAAQYARLKGRIGHPKAIGAVKHSILVAIYHMLTDDVAYRELGGDYFQRRLDPDRQIRRHVRELERLGMAVTVQPAA